MLQQKHNPSNRTDFYLILQPLVFTGGFFVALMVKPCYYITMNNNTVIPNKDELKKAYMEYKPSLSEVLAGIEAKLKNNLELSTAPTFKSRIKLFKSYYKKLLRLKPSSLGTMRLPVLSDILGIRVICPFLQDLTMAEKQIISLFTVREIERKGADRTFREFGYESTHILVEIPSEIKEKFELPEGLLCEIQIRTILQDAWAEVEHELVYKSEFSPFDLPLKRKLASMNASLSLADIIFQEIRDYQNKLNTELGQRRFTFYDKTEKISHEKIIGEVSEKTKNAETIASASPYVQGTIDDLILTAIQAHNNGNLDMAINVYTHITVADPKPNNVIMSVVFKHRGLAYFAQSKYQNALQDFLSSAELDPAGSRSYYYIGIVYSILGDEIQAIKYFSKSLELQEYQAHVYFRRALSLFHLGDYSASLADLDRCKSLGFEDEDCLLLRTNLIQKLQMN